MKTFSNIGRCARWLFLALVSMPAMAAQALPTAPSVNLWRGEPFKLALSLEELMQQQSQPAAPSPARQAPASLEDLMRQQERQDAQSQAREQRQKAQIEQRRQAAERANAARLAALSQCQSGCSEAFTRCESQASSLTTQSLVGVLLGGFGSSQAMTQQAMSQAQQSDDVRARCYPEQTSCNSACEQQANRVATAATSSSGGGGGATGDCESTVNNLSAELERITGTLAGGSMCQAQRPLYDYYRNRAIPEIRRACPASNANAAQTLAYLQGEVDRMTPMFTSGGMCNVH